VRLLGAGDAGAALAGSVTRAAHLGAFMVTW
jgi:hypothetical protein